MPTPSISSTASHPHAANHLHQRDSIRMLTTTGAHGKGGGGRSLGPGPRPGHRTKIRIKKREGKGSQKAQKIITLYLLI